MGHAGAAMDKLTASGLVPAIKAQNKPTLGICVGMQLLTSYSEEGDSDMLGIFPIKTLKFTADPDLWIAILTGRSRSRRQWAGAGLPG